MYLYFDIFMENKIFKFEVLSKKSIIKIRYLLLKFIYLKKKIKVIPSSN